MGPNILRTPFISRTSEAPPALSDDLSLLRISPRGADHPPSQKTVRVQGLIKKNRGIKSGFCGKINQEWKNEEAKLKRFITYYTPPLFHPEDVALRGGGLTGVHPPLCPCGLIDGEGMFLCFPQKVLQGTNHYFWSSCGQISSSVSFSLD